MEVGLPDNWKSCKIQRMRSGVQVLNFDIDELRQRLGKMPDEKLREFGEAARYMCSPRAVQGKPPLPVYMIQLEEAIAEWRRRYPKAQNHLYEANRS